MKKIINVTVGSRKVDLADCETDLLCVGLFSDAKVLDKVNGELDKRLGGAIWRVVEPGDFKGKSGTSALVYGEGIAAKRVLLVGLGEKKKATLDTVRGAAACAANRAVGLKVENISLALHKAFGKRFDLAVAGQASAEGVYFGSYRYDEYITESEDGRLDKLSVELVDSDAVAVRKLQKGLLSGAVVGAAQSYARTVANRPGNVINPASLAEEAKKLASGSKQLSCTIFDEKQLAAKGMGGILAVGSGSQNKPRLIVLKYSSSKAAKSKPTVALVGKAVTFDSGGLNLKPSRGMGEMKFDKVGGIAVLGAMKAIAELNLGVNVYGIIPAAENMPGGSSYRPSDIVTTFSGKTVEIGNTDAEGRMILCDAISYADKQGCDVIVDIATLTGACKIALGKHMAGVMSNDTKLLKQLQQAAKLSGEKVWHMPSGDEYAEEMKSKVADLTNSASPWGGVCSAAAFLRQFAGERKWAHLDIAGVDMFEKGTKFAVAGSSGFGVRLLVSYVTGLAGKR
ncbi:MAG: leucyl aminopeptidase [Planctomycetes bacterium]|nr:leucyl aminopeptidase [Planctomycetota bacterium]